MLESVLLGYFDATKHEFGIRNAKINRVNEQKKFVYPLLIA